MPYWQVVDPAGVGPALARALAGGPPVAPVADRGAAALLRTDLPPEVEDCAALVATSGSTGVPKGVLLTATALRAAVEATHRHLGGPGDWVLALPPQHVAGLMVLARGAVAGTAVTPIGSDLQGLADLPRPAGRRYLSIVPTQAIRALGSPSTLAALSGFDAVLIGGSALDPAVLAALGTQGVSVVTTYGMSETCGGCVYDGRALPGVDVRREVEGHLSIGGPMLFSGYHGLPEETARVLIDGRFHTADRGRLVDRRWQIAGRVDAVVQSGGSNVDLAAIEAVLQRVLAGDGEGVVLGLPDREWGTEVVAVTDTDLSRDALRPHLSGAALPRRVITVSRLPRTDSGKIDRQELIRRLTDERE